MSDFTYCGVCPECGAYWISTHTRGPLCYWCNAVMKNRQVTTPLASRWPKKGRKEKGE